MKIREIIPQDDSQIGALIRKVITESKAPKTGTSFSDPELDSLSLAFSGQRSIYLIVEDNDLIMGGAGINPLNGSNNRICELQKMYFLNEARSKGWGGKILDMCLKYAIENSFKSCYIETMTFMKAAQKLYLKRGFKYIDKPIGNTGHINCNIWMIKKFK